jgi:hypothetical protein
LGSGIFTHGSPQFYREHKEVKDPNLVGALSEHKEGSKAFARYRTFDDDMKKELIGMLE